MGGEKFSGVNLFDDEATMTFRATRLKALEKNGGRDWLIGKTASRQRTSRDAHSGNGASLSTGK